jgi:hypothetical protein
MQDISSAELQALAELYKDRDAAISSGMVFQGVRYEVRLQSFSHWSCRDSPRLEGTLIDAQA